MVKLTASKAKCIMAGTAVPVKTDGTLGNSLKRIWIMADSPSEILSDTHFKDAKITDEEKEVLRRLAGKVAELADRKIEQEKRLLWTKHNDLGAQTRPLVFCDPENGWDEIITTEQMQCHGKLARQWEYRLRKELFWAESMCDDRVVEPSFDIMDIYTRTDWGLREVYHGGEQGGAKSWDSPIKDLDDISQLRFPSIDVDQKATNRLVELAEHVFGDLLPVRRRNMWYWTLGLTQVVIKLRGLENMMLDMYDNPEGLHRLMAFIRDGTQQMVDFLEGEGLYTLNNEGDYVGSGGFGWTSQLPAAGFDGHVRTVDLWCLSESQETVGVSPEMFEEFIFPYQLPIVERFGLVCYGCCEPIHSRWHVVRRIPNLRRVSVSPWCDRAQMAEQLKGDYIYSLKSHPGPLAMPHFDADAVRSDTRDALARAKGCRLEIIMKDNNTICNDPSRVVNWVRIVREEIDRIYGC